MRWLLGLTLLGALAGGVAIALSGRAHDAGRAATEPRSAHPVVDDPARPAAPVAEPRPHAREPVAPASRDEEAEALRARVAALEAEVARLREELERSRSGEPHPTAASLRAAIKDLDPNDSVGQRGRNERRAQLIEQYLERYPGEPDAAEKLDLLCTLYLGWLRDPADALAALERHGVRVGLPTWKRDSLAANVLDLTGRAAEAEEAYLRIAHATDAPEHERWRARFAGAHVHMKRGEYDEARWRFEELLRLAGDDPPASIRDVVAGARNQLEDIERITGRR